VEVQCVENEDCEEGCGADDQGVEEQGWGERLSEEEEEGYY